MGEISYVTAWRQERADLASDAMRIWSDYGALPADADAEARSKDLCVMAYDGEAVAGVSTIALDMLAPVRARVGFFRCFVLPDYRRLDTARQMTIRAKQVLAEWSEENPDEKVFGMALIVQARELSNLARVPVWPNTDLAVMGYSAEGYQVRLTWFDHVTLPAEP